MADTPIPNSTKTNGGMAGVLMTLAGSGDNWVKLLIVGGIILNGVMTKNNGKGISSNSADIDKVRQEIAAQIKVIHGNQKTYLKGIRQARANHEAIMEKLGIAPTPTPYPRQEEDEEESEQ